MAKFSIILPVKNGGHYVKECVESILTQTFTDFDFLVLDNQSTDGTLEWIQSISDARIKVYPADRPLSIEQNWNRIITIPKNGFITLIGHDDLLNENYLATMNDLILKFPDASLYQTHFTYINAQGEKIRDCKVMSEIESAEEFLGKFLRREIDVMGTGFMMRSQDYDTIGGIPLYPNLLFADFELWIELARKSYKATSSKKCFSFRIHQSTTTISSDIKYHEAFQKFVLFLQRLRKGNQEFGKVIQSNLPAFLEFYCKGLSHRLLRTPKEKRNGLSVRKFVFQCKEYAEMLEIGNDFKPEKIFSIRLAILIDSNIASRSFFLWFKKIYSKPILK